MWNYSEAVRDHYLHPRNVGEIENPDGIGEVGNIACGDALRLTFKLDKDGKIAEAKFKTFGCGSAIASASVLTELIVGKTIEEASKITNKVIAESLGGLPREKMHCSVMGQEALEAAINYYKTGGTSTAPVEKEHGTVVCTCFNITDTEIERAIRENNLRSVDDVTNFTKAGGGCGGCVPSIQEILDKVNGASSASAVRPEKLTTLQKIDKIREVIRIDIQPILNADGGGCDLVDVDGNIVYIKFRGHCAGCHFSGATMRSVVERKLREKVMPDLTVKEA